MQSFLNHKRGKCPYTTPDIEMVSEQLQMSLLYASGETGGEVDNPIDGGDD